MVPELDPNNPDTHVVLREGDVISSSEAQRFRDQLKEIAGISPQGLPRLEMVWGPTYEDPMSTTSQLKYVDFTDQSGRAFGERRWFIQIHRTPEFLARSGRYQLETRQDTDGTKLLKSLPSQGCYDYWLRLERKNLTYHPPDNEALEVTKALWRWEQMSQTERDLCEQADRELERRQMIAAMRQSGAIYTGAVPFNQIPR